MDDSLLHGRFRKTTIDQVTISNLTMIEGDSTQLVVFENSTKDKSIERIFFIKASKKVARGRHAHRTGDQWLVCLEGSIEVFVHDGARDFLHTLNDASKVLHVPPGIWSSQVYQEDSILLVICDLKFSEQDYIRSWEEFLFLKGTR